MKWLGWTKVKTPEAPAGYIKVYMKSGAEFIMRVKQGENLNDVYINLMDRIGMARDAFVRLDATLHVRGCEVEALKRLKEYPRVQSLGPG